MFFLILTLIKVYFQVRNHILLIVTHLKDEKLVASKILLHEVTITIFTLTYHPALHPALHSLQDHLFLM